MYFKRRTESEEAKEPPGICISNKKSLNLIANFLRCPILDRKGVDHSNQRAGIPQGSPLSPVLMNVFMHEFDKRMEVLLIGEVALAYLRYADDMLFVFEKGGDSTRKYRLFRQSFKEALRSLKLEATSSSIARGKPGKLTVLGLQLSIGPCRQTNLWRRNGILYK